MKILPNILALLFKEKFESKTQENKYREMSKKQLTDHVTSVVDEYNLIQYGTSKLSRRKRDEVIAYMKKLEELDYVKINKQ